MSGVGGLMGMAMAAGILVIAAWVEAARPPSILRRIRPPWTPSEPSGRFTRLREVGGGSRSTAIAASSAGCGCVAGIAVGGVATGVLLGAAAACAVWWIEARLRARGLQSRARAVEQCVPAFAELLALATSAGAGVPAALESCAQHLAGPLQEEIAGTVAELRSGVGVEMALRSLDARARSRSLTRIIDSVLVARDRGTPVADVLRAQAMDVRADQARQLMESAGRKDVAMLVPIVFLVLPAVVLVALFPGAVALRAFLP